MKINPPLPQIFKASSITDDSNSKPKFPFDNDLTDDFSEEDYECEFCHNMISKHSTRQIVQCGINILKRGVND